MVDRLLVIVNEDHSDGELDREQVRLLINERRNYEQQLYDFLVNPFTFIPESFWEPVPVSFEHVKNLKDSIGEKDCSICLEKHLNFKIHTCCKQTSCNNCCITWFKKSVKCPFCNQDIRDFT
jgi:hypothetical protein